MRRLLQYIKTKWFFLLIVAGLIAANVWIWWGLISDHTWINNGRFLQNFLPNFISTLLGIILGIPTALFLNRKITENTEKIKTQEERKLLIESLEVVNSTLQYNNAVFQKSLEKLKTQAIFDIPLDFATWEITKSPITDYLQDLKLKKRVSFHFSRIKFIIKVSDLYFKYSVESAVNIEYTTKLRNSIKDHLEKQMSKLINEAEQLYTEINSKIDELKKMVHNNK